jgi:hypothetical protein
MHFKNYKRKYENVHIQDYLFKSVFLSRHLKGFVLIWGEIVSHWPGWI